MAYNRVSQDDDVHSSSSSNYSASPPPQESDAPHLFLASNIIDGNTKKYEILDDDDYTQPDAQNGLNTPKTGGHEHEVNGSSQQTSSTEEPKNLTRSASPEPATADMRTASFHSTVSVPLRHPTPDVYIPGSKVGNVEQLERTAERFSMTSDIALEIQKLSSEQKRPDSRRSSLLGSPEQPSASKQFPSNSIVEINNAARSGGYSPGGFALSPQNSFSNRGRSASSRYTSRLETEHEGKRLDSFVNSLPTLSPVDSRASSFAEGAEMSMMTRALAGADIAQSPIIEEAHGNAYDAERPTTSASQTTIEQAQRMFQDFDGVHSHHFVPRSRAASTNEDNIPAGTNFAQSVRISNIPPHPSLDFPDSSGIDERISKPPMAPPSNRPPAFEGKDGNQYLYYPAPVPESVILPPKLNRNSAMPRRKSGAFGSSDTTASRRISGISGHPVLGYSFNHPSIDKRIPGRKKEQPPTHSLNAALDASASTPANAFVDHAISGTSLGAEVYGKEGQSKAVAEEDEKKTKRRSSFGNWLARKSGMEYDFNTVSADLTPQDIQKARAREKEKERRRSLMAMSDSGMIQQNNGRAEEAVPLNTAVDDGDEGQLDDEYTGPPTTLMAELALRKQQAKNRTRPITSVYPNGARSTLLELDSVAEAEKRARQGSRIRLAWEESRGRGIDDDDDDVPLAALYPGQGVGHPHHRASGLLQQREMEDNEPLSRRRERLAQSRRAHSMLDMQHSGEEPAKRESTFLPKSRPVSGAFSAELLSQFGDLGDDASGEKGKGKATDAGTPVPEEQETLAQRKKRLRAEKQAREAEFGPGLGIRPVPAQQTQLPPPQEQRPQLRQRRSMADILSAHPAGRASPGPQYITKRSSSYNVGGGLLALHDQEARRRSSALNMEMIKNKQPPGTQKQTNRASTMTMGMAPPNMQAFNGGGMMPFYSPTMPMGMNMNQMNGMNGMNLMQQQQAMAAMMMTGAYGGIGMPFQGMGMGMNMMPAMGGYNNGMGMGMPGVGAFGQQMNGMGTQGMVPMAPLTAAQLDAVERWRQGVAQ